MQHRPTFHRLWGLMAVTLLTWGCGNNEPTGAGLAGTEGASESVAPTDGMRLVKGVIPKKPEAPAKDSSGAVSVELGLSGGCMADIVTAEDTKGHRTETTVDTDCHFALNLKVDEAFKLHFMQGDQELAVLHVPVGSDDFVTPFIVIEAGNIDIDIGNITLINNVAIGDDDHDTKKDDGKKDDGKKDDGKKDDGKKDDGKKDDGKKDDDKKDHCKKDDGKKDEVDCNLNGIPDRVEKDVKCTVGDLKKPHVLHVKPFDGQDDVHPRQKVKLWASCAIDQKSVTGQTFKVVGEKGDVITCEFSFTGGKSQGRKIECRHDKDPFKLHKKYTATVDGVKCTDGKLLNKTTWSWTTADKDDGKDCGEDIVDQQLEAKASASGSGEASASGDNAQASASGSGSAEASVKDDDDCKKHEPKKDEPKKDEPKKDEPKKDEPKKDEPKKDDGAQASASGSGSAEAKADGDDAHAKAEGKGNAEAKADGGDASAKAGGSGSAEATADDDGQAHAKADGKGDAAANAGDGDANAKASGSGSAEADAKGDDANAKASGSGSAEATATDDDPSHPKKWSHPTTDDDSAQAKASGTGTAEANAGDGAAQAQGDGSGQASASTH